jgi:integrase
MSPSVNILRRAKIDGRWQWVTRGRIPRGVEVRWHVRFRPGGRGPTHNAGTFRTRAEAEERAAWVARELAAGRFPDLTVNPPTPPAPEPTGPTALDVLDAYTRWRSRKVGAARRNTFHQTRAHLAASPLAGQLADQVTAHAGQDWVDDLTEPTVTDDGAVRPGLAPKSIQMHLGVLRAAWRRAAIHPNPWADVIPPRREHDDDDVRAPRWDEWNAILGGVPRRHVDTVIVLEATGLRIGELERLTWGAVDFAGAAITVRAGKTKSARRRVPLPDAAADAVARQTPLEDRDPDAPVFAHLRSQTVRGAIARACTRAGIPGYSPHSLRHRYASRLVAARVPLPLAVEIFGHANPTVFLNTYSHVLIDEPAWRLTELRRDVARLYGMDEDLHGVAPVSSHSTEPSPTNEKSPAHGGAFTEVEDSGFEGS